MREPEIKRQNQILVGKIVTIFNKSKLKDINLAKNIDKDKPFQLPDNRGKVRSNIVQRVIEQDNKV